MIFHGNCAVSRADAGAEGTSAAPPSGPAIGRESMTGHGKHPGTADSERVRGPAADFLGSC